MTAGTGVYWGELPCLAAPGAFVLTRSTGFEPSVATMQVLFSDVETWGQRHDPTRFQNMGRRSVPAIVDALNLAAPKAFTPIQRLPYKAPLVIVSVQGGVRREVRLPDFYLLGAEPLETAARPHVIQLTFVDVRYWWTDYGVLTKDFNVPKAKARDGTITYERGSLRNEGGTLRPHRVDEIVSAALLALPGQPQLVRFPELADKRPREVRCAGSNPREVARGILEDLRLTFAFSIDGVHCAVWKPGEGDVGEAPGGVGVLNVDKHDPGIEDRGAWAGAVPEEDNKVAQRLVRQAADDVLVTGARPIYTVQVDYLEPVVPIERRQPDGSIALDWWEVTPDLFEKLLAAGFGPVADRPQPALPDVDDPAQQPVAPIPRTPTRSSAFPPVAEDELSLPAFVLKAALGAQHPSVPVELLDMVAPKLWRFWRLQKRYRRLLDVLDRAERDEKGNRLPPAIEAFTWRAIEVDVSAEAELLGLREDATTEEEIEFAQITAELERVRHRLNQIQLPNAKEVRALYEEFAANPVAGAQAALANLGAEHAREGQLGQVPEPGPGDGTAGAKASRVGLKITGDVLGIADQKALDPVGREIEALRAQERDLAGRRLALLEEIDPASAIREKLEAAGQKHAKTLAQTGRVDQAVVDELLALQRELDKALEAEPLKPKRPVLELVHANEGRHVVESHLVDASQGIWETARPCGWLADPLVFDAAGTHVTVMPVRAIFGSWNRDPGGHQSGDAPPLEGVNVFVAAAAGAVSRDRELMRLAGDFGHVVPAAPSSLTRFTFTRDDLSGDAAIGPFPLRITDPEVQLLVPLPRAVGAGGQVQRLDNRAELLAAARARAEPLLHDEWGRAGTFRVLEPRNVQLNGVVSGVRWEMVDDAGLVDTIVSLEPTGDAFHDFERVLPPREPEPLVFGFDPRDYR